MKVHCPKCGAPLQFRDELLGKHGHCPKCHGELVAEPEHSTPPVPPLEAPATPSKVFTATWGAVAVFAFGAITFILHDLITRPSAIPTTVAAAALPATTPTTATTIDKPQPIAVQPVASSVQELRGKVVRVIDGDTITILDDWKTEHKIRLEGIDAPESEQPFGAKAKSALADKIFAASVIVKWQKLDKYNRILGEVFKDDRHINLDMVQEGWAWHYRQYSSDEDLERAEVAARNAKAGLWADANPVAPWDWRHGEAARVVAESPTENEAPKVDDAGSQTNDPIVYVTRTGSKYHVAGCSHLSKSKIPIKLSEAEKRYSPCSVCCGSRLASTPAIPSETLVPQAAATETPSPDMPATDPQPSVTPSVGRTFIGPRGGVYHYSKSGRKVYERRRR
jgi:endonuclease YncB( thermonuclease family)